MTDISNLRQESKNKMFLSFKLSDFLTGIPNNTLFAIFASVQERTMLLLPLQALNPYGKSTAQN